MIIAINSKVVWIKNDMQMVRRPTMNATRKTGLAGKWLVFTPILFVVLFSFQAASAADLLLAGSTTVQKRILEPSAAAIEKATGVKVTVRGVNSGNGFQELRDGKVKASISSSPLSLLLEKAGLADDGTFIEHVIIQDIIVPIVNLSNPVSELTWDQLSDLHTGKITNWKEVGGPDGKVAIITSQPTAATRVVFQKQVMNKAPYVDGAREVKSTRQEVSLVSKLRGGLGAVSEGFVAMNAGKVKVIKTAQISRPLSIITKGAPAKDVQAVVDFLTSPKAQENFK